MRLEKLSRGEDAEWRERFAAENWAMGAITLSITLPEWAGGEEASGPMHFGYYLQPLHLNLHDREEIPRKLLWRLAHRRPPVNFLELSGAGIRIPHAFPPGFTASSVMRITLQELQKIPLQG